MSSERWETIQRVFLRALKVSEPERGSYLDGACGNDPAARQEVEALLRASEEARSRFLHAPSPDAEGLGSSSTTMPERGGSDADTPPLPEAVGPYRLLGVLGEGGMGIVYLAEQLRPVERRVALKVIRLGMDSREVVARFETERQALALLNHPHIAKVHDAGATADGRPYFVMEHVEGLPLTEYCSRERLSIPMRLGLFIQVCHGIHHAHQISIPMRLGLFIQVCHGIHHAHQKGIIHRDIKPSNILVTVADDNPIAKIIDFGIAPATDQRLTEKTLYTEVGRAVGTPAYMSPEQARMTPGEIDHCTDIYSLGVLLYELLVDELPLEREVVRKAAFHEILRRILEEDPPTPSVHWTRLNLEETRRRAQERRTDPTALRHKLRGDLDWITMKALAKEPAQSYASATELAADVGRHLRHEPVRARPPNASYRMRKYVRRNRGPVAAASLVVAILAVSVVVISFFGTVAQQRLTRVQRLSDLKRLQLFETEAEGLWPAVPVNLPPSRTG
jgi:serine/threonine protein kinase